MISVILIKVISELKKLISNGMNIKGISTMGSDVPHILSEISQYFGLGPSKFTSTVTTNKLMLKNKLLEGGFPIPHFSKVYDYKQL